MVPISYWVIGAMGIQQAIAIRIASGTSLFVILFMALSGARRHSQKEMVQWKAALILGLCGLAGALTGATLAARIPGNALATGLGGLLLIAALWMGLGQRVMPKSAGEHGAGIAFSQRNVPWLWAASGFPIGVLVGISGLGGGVLIIPVLVLIFHFPIHIAIGTSLASIIFTSLGGIIGYIANGIGMSPLPYSIGYINLPIWLCLTATSMPMAQLGAKAAHALPAKQLRYLFITLMVFMGLKMIGIF